MVKAGLPELPRALPTLSSSPGLLQQQEQDPTNLYLSNLPRTLDEKVSPVTSGCGCQLPTECRFTPWLKPVAIGFPKHLVVSLGNPLTTLGLWSQGGGLQVPRMTFGLLA